MLFFGVYLERERCGLAEDHDYDMPRHESESLSLVDIFARSRDNSCSEFELLQYVREGCCVNFDADRCRGLSEMTFG